MAGDSWACGEWDWSPEYKITHRGLTDYVTEHGYTVVNLSKPGGNNTEAAERVDNFLQVSSHLNISQIFVFQTEWTREMEGEPIAKDFEYTEIKSRILSRFYQRLSQCFHRLDVPINLIGGCSDTVWSDTFSREYPGVQILCQSLTNLAITGDHRISEPVYSVWNRRCEYLLSAFKKYGKDGDLELILHDVALGHQRADLWGRETQYFYPDGLHANSKVHKTLFELIKNTIPNF